MQENHQGNQVSPNMPSIRMGEMEVCLGGQLRSLLGSCIGVALYDSAHQVGGLAHIVLPQSPSGNDEMPGKYADSAIPLLIRRTQQLVAAQTQLRAKIAGGANMFATRAVETIGEQNVAAIERLLEEYQIPIVARHCGGTKGRRMTLDTTTGRVSIDVVGMETIDL